MSDENEWDFGDARGLDFNKLRRGRVTDRTVVLPNNGRPAGRRQTFDGKTMPFGKHAGTELTKVPVGYIGWIFEAQLAGEMAQTDALNAALVLAFIAQVRAIPAVHAELQKLFVVEKQSTVRPIVLGDSDSEPL